jgi:hypothetical protein
LVRDFPCRWEVVTICRKIKSKHREEISEGRGSMRRVMGIRRRNKMPKM